ncbi:unnamed protein product [Ceratitis capitata]|uniref:(Mediterranean fruit fly) hypothetical protein n=1 Tax=Ceratitis capitata TaxID=7213 RepID=A0A811US75_CERCA|nr:unnamed protein product [Ceratitis capitata]
MSKQYLLMQAPLQNPTSIITQRQAIIHSHSEFRHLFQTKPYNYNNSNSANNTNINNKTTAQNTQLKSTTARNYNLEFQNLHFNSNRQIISYPPINDPNSHNLCLCHSQNMT